MLKCHNKYDDQYLDLRELILSHQDVAVKVYVGNEYSENTLQDYKKEVHLNLLLLTTFRTCLSMIIFGSPLLQFRSK